MVFLSEDQHLLARLLLITSRVCTISVCIFRGSLLGFVYDQ